MSENVKICSSRRSQQKGCGSATLIRGARPTGRTGTEGRESLMMVAVSTARVMLEWINTGNSTSRSLGHLQFYRIAINQSNSCDQLETIYSNGFLQKVGKATRISNNSYSLIDHILYKKINWIPQSQEQLSLILVITFLTLLEFQIL